MLFEPSEFLPLAKSTAAWLGSLHSNENAEKDVRTIRTVVRQANSCSSFAVEHIPYCCSGTASC